MFKLLFSTFLFLNVSLVALETSEITQKNHMLADIDFIKKTFEYHYAPAEWKRELFGWDLQSKYQSAVDAVKKNKRNDIKRFQKSLMKLCCSARDYHVSILSVFGFFTWFNDNAHEAHQLLELYSRIKVGATARLSRAKEEDFPWTENVLYNGNAMPLNDLEWRLYSLSGSPDENKETIFLLADKMHRFKGQKPTDGMRYFKENEDFLKNAQIPLRELMFLRQQLFVEIVEAAENYPLFGRAKPLDLKSEQEHRAAVEQVLSLMKKHAATDFESQAQSVYEDVIEAF